MLLLAVYLHKCDVVMNAKIMTGLLNLYSGMKLPIQRKSKLIYNSRRHSWRWTKERDVNEGVS